MSATAVETVTGDWGPPVRILCPAFGQEPDPCDCGFVGLWERRTVYVWYDRPGHRRADSEIRRDIARGWPAKTDAEGWWVISGWDERCPGCGDIERFDESGDVIDRYAEHAKVIVSMAAWRPAR